MPASSEITKWVQLALKTKSLTDITIDTNGQTNSDDGYLGNINFIKVNGKNKKNQNETINLVIKASQESVILRQQTPVKELYVQEKFIYTEVVPVLNNFITEMGLEANFLDFVPYCYTAEILENSEIIVLEDLRAQGYIGWDRMVPLPISHITLLLKNYGKWHGTALALRYHKKELYQNLVKDMVNTFSYFFENAGLFPVLYDCFIEARNSVIGEETDLLKHLQFSQDDGYKICKDLFFEDPEHSVIIHGDAWVNNFLFQGTSTNPKKAYILDFQGAGISSPIMDLAHLFYTSCDLAKHNDVTEFLKIYYNSLSDCLRQFGCDPEIVFSYAKLLEHWKRFSRFGIFLQGFTLKTVLCDKDYVPDFVETAENGGKFVENFKIKVQDKNVYNERVRANFLHYVKNLDI